MEHIKAISAALLDGGRQQSGGGKAAGRHDIVVTRHRRRHATTVSSDFFCVPFGGARQRARLYTGPTPSATTAARRRVRRLRIYSSYCAGTAARASRMPAAAPMATCTN